MCLLEGVIFFALRTSALEVDISDAFHPVSTARHHLCELMKQQLDSALEIKSWRARSTRWSGYSPLR